MKEEAENGPTIPLTNFCERVLTATGISLPTYKRICAKSGDYHDDMNHANFSKWVETQLIPNLPERSVLVVDNASYHNVKAEKSPTSGSRKDEIINWLTQHNVKHNPKVTKPELYKLIMDHKEQETTYHLDTLLEQHDHKVLRLPLIIRN
ncbi:hypothetical protein NQ314_012492 [Rhamnusium bicolor]|uniref:Tc1-like transposase DDE domain-containing protein n=1 Tax=Rhamnusium bicolor TaxID=1586634 RepID=A0AAV8XBC0_9CUCU|nr:hypothetical protein NQ314_012492 [Rhamnusium bicolor]